MRAGADCIQGLRYSLELSPVAERPEPAAGGAAGGGAGARNPLAASGLWEGGWSRRSPYLLWLTVAHDGLLWLTMARCGSLWLTMAHYGSLWLEPVSHSTSLYSLYPL